MKKCLLIFIGLPVLIFLIWPRSFPFKKTPSAPEIIVATSTSLYDSGLLDQLIEAFEKQSGVKVKTIACGTGEALRMGRKGEADLLLVHAPELEAEFMASGYGLCRQEIMFSRIVIVGPENDPAGIRGLNFPEAFARIAHSKTPFISRADFSGTYFLERKIWEEAGIKPGGRWYLESQQGMAEALIMAAEKKAYLLTDFPTYSRFRSRLNLIVLASDDNYRNIYSIIIPRSTRQFGTEEPARKLWTFLFSPKSREIIASFGYETRTEPPLHSPLISGPEDNKN